MSAQQKVFAYTNAFNILPYMLFLNKQKQRLAANCFNSVLVENWRLPELFCHLALPDKIDFGLWTDEMQEQACDQAMESAKATIGDVTTACENPDSPDCNPCGKVLDTVFDKYSGLFQSVVATVTQDL